RVWQKEFKIQAQECQKESKITIALTKKLIEQAQILECRPYEITYKDLIGIIQQINTAEGSWSHLAREASRYGFHKLAKQAQKEALYFDSLLQQFSPWLNKEPATKDTHQKTKEDFWEILKEILNK